MDRELPARARAVMGLYRMGWRSSEEIASVVFNPASAKATERQTAYVRGLLRSKDPRVTRAMRYGLFGTGATAKPVRCPRCRRLVNNVPCVGCFIANDVAIRPRPPRQTTYTATRPRKPSKACAGSEAKIRIMRDRVARGDSPFHPDDLMHSDPPHPVEVCQVAVEDLTAAYKDRRR